MGLTPQQENVMQQLEQYCKEHGTDVWVGVIDWNVKQVLNQLEQLGYVAPYQQFSGKHCTIKPTREEGMQRDAIRASYEE
jgi:hypothetical protein